MEAIGKISGIDATMFESRKSFILTRFLCDMTGSGNRPLIAEKCWMKADYFLMVYHKKLAGKVVTHDSVKYMISFRTMYS
jgi:hypothetical protein